jgi:GTP1/Obg family GTP-binding protein
VAKHNLIGKIQVRTQPLQLVETHDRKTLLDQPMKVPNEVNRECVVALIMLLYMIFS